MPRLRLVSMVLAVVLIGCAGTASTSAVAQDEAPRTLAPADPSAMLEQSEDENLQWSASVVKVDFVPDQDNLTVKLFGVAGGDPAMNGLYTYIAFLGDPHEAWRLYRVGDFLDYRILSASPDRVELEILESTLNATTTEIGSRTRSISVSWTLGADGLPASVTVTPAQ